MKKLKEMFFSERGMSIVNMLFCLSLLIRVGWLTVMTCACSCSRAANFASL